MCTDQVRVYILGCQGKVIFKNDCPIPPSCLTNGKHYVTSTPNHLPKNDFIFVNMPSMTGRVQDIKLLPFLEAQILLRLHESSTFSLVNALKDAVFCTQFQMVCRLDSKLHLQIQVKKSWLRSKSHLKHRRRLKNLGRDPISLQKSKPHILLWPTEGQFSQANGGLITELRKLIGP